MLGNGIFHGMYNPATVWCLDSAVDFDGVNDYAITNFTTSVLLNEFLNRGSISLWIRSRAADKEPILQIQDASSDEGASMTLWYDKTGKAIQFQRTNTAGGTPSTLPSEEITNAEIQNLHHVVLTWNTNGMNMYVDGVDQDLAQSPI